MADLEYGSMTGINHGRGSMGLSFDFAIGSLSFGVNESGEEDHGLSWGSHVNIDALETRALNENVGWGWSLPLGLVSVGEQYTPDGPYGTLSIDRGVSLDISVARDNPTTNMGALGSRSFDLIDPNAGKDAGEEICSPVRSSTSPNGWYWQISRIDQNGNPLAPVRREVMDTQTALAISSGSVRNKGNPNSEKTDELIVDGGIATSQTGLTEETQSHLSGRRETNIREQASHERELEKQTAQLEAELAESASKEEAPEHGYDKDGAQPVVLDLDGNGISVTELAQSRHFVDGCDGLKHRTAWAAAGDGVLFFDAMGDGQINERREYVFTDWDPTATSDLEDLRSVFDTNRDGKDLQHVWHRLSPRNSIDVGKGEKRVTLITKWKQIAASEQETVCSEFESIEDGMIYCTQVNSLLASPGRATKAKGLWQRSIGHQAPLVLLLRRAILFLFVAPRTRRLMAGQSRQPSPYRSLFNIFASSVFPPILALAFVFAFATGSRGQEAAICDLSPHSDAERISLLRELRNQNAHMSWQCMLEIGTQLSEENQFILPYTVLSIFENSPGFQGSAEREFWIRAFVSSGSRASAQAADETRVILYFIDFDQNVSPLRSWSESGSYFFSIVPQVQVSAETKRLAWCFVQMDDGISNVAELESSAPFVNCVNGE